MNEYPKLRKNYVSYMQEYVIDETTTHGSVPWVLGGDESGAFVPGEEQRFSVYAIVGVPFFTYAKFCTSIPSSRSYKFSEDQFAPLTSLLKQCFGHGVVVYFDLDDSRMVKVIERHKKLRRASSLQKPAKSAHAIWLNLMGFSIIEFVGTVAASKNAPVGNLHIHYDEKDMTSYMKELMATYIPKQAEIRLRGIFEGLVSDLGYNRFPKADPRIEEFDPGKTKEPLIMSADLLARTFYRDLFQNAGVVSRSHETLVIKNLTDTLIEVPEHEKKRKRGHT